MNVDPGSFASLNPRDNQRTKIDEPEYLCSLCKNCFSNKKLYFDHLGSDCIRVDDDDGESNAKSRDQPEPPVPTLVLRPFKCELCELVFDRVSQLDNHRRSVHRQERSQVCQICGKGFFRHTDLKTHLNIHLGTNRCMCEVCGRKFNHVSNLIRHGRTHSGVKPYPCTICGKRFTQINTLARHKAIHKIGGRSLDCSFCNKRYKSENGLREHMKKLHGFTERLTSEDNEKIIKRRHYCKICGESFQFVELLRDHEKTHQNDETLECKSCDQKFRKTDEIKEHRCGRQLKLIPYPEVIESKIITEQVADTASHFLHKHLMELAVEDNISPRESDEETVVSEMINSCWKEIEIPDVDESHVAEKRISASKNNSQSIIHVLASKKFCQDKIESKKLMDCQSNTTRNLTNAKPTRGLRSGIPRDYFGENNSGNINDLLIDGTVNPAVTHNDDINVAGSAIGKSVTEPTLRLVKTENGEEFYELLITNCPEKSDNSYESDRISIETVLESLRPRQQNEPIPESLLKVVHLENGQRVLEIMKNTLGVEEAIKDFSSSSVSIEEETIRAEENKNEKIIYYAPNNKENLIDFFEIETLGNQEAANSFNLSEEVMQNVQQTNFDALPTLNRNGKDIEDHESPTHKEGCEELLGLIHNTDHTKSVDKINKIPEEAPMVRLVQNEDGAQFFELIRGDLEFEDPIELVERTEYHPEDPLQLGKHGESGSTIKLETDLPRVKKKYKNKEKKYNCDVCKKSFSKGYNYRQHIGTHFADQQKFKCKECGQFFAWKSTLNKHIATHRAGGQQKFVCEICPKVYTTLSQVNEHVKRDHLKERNNKCTECGKTFFKKFDLKIHIRTHTKERPYECRVCYKSFHHQSHIIRHERIHSGERPYACNICEKTFTQLGSLKSHRQRHQELKIDILDYQMDEDEPLPRTTL